MDTLEERVRYAKQDREERNRLVAEYVPFIKKQVSRFPDSYMEREDMVSIAMLTFSGCIMQYEPQKGKFLSFAGICIRNRLIDELRKCKAAPVIVPLYEEGGMIWESGQLSMTEYDREQERESLAEEIEEISKKLAEYGINFLGLPKVCPKHKKARQRCMEAARLVIQEGALKEKLLVQKQLPQKDLAGLSGLSIKTIEKHRKYIILLALILLGGYPGIRTFLPDGEEEMK